MKITRTLICIASLLVTIVLALPSSTVAAPMYNITDLDTLGGSSRATSINDSGQVVGSSSNSPGSGSSAHAFRYDAITGMTDLGMNGESVAMGINDSGQIVGYSYLGGSLYRAFLHDGRDMIDLGHWAADPAMHMALTTRARWLEIH